MRSVILAFACFIGILSDANGACDSDTIRMRFMPNTLYTFERGQWRPLLPNVSNSLSTKETRKYAYLLRHQRPFTQASESEDVAALLLKSTNFSSEKDSSLPASVYIDSNQKARFLQEKPIGFVDLSDYMFLHLGRTKIYRSKLAAFHLHYRNKGISKNTYSGIRKFAFLFDEVDISLLEEENPKLGSLIKEIKAGRGIDKILNDVKLINFAHAKNRFQFKSTEEKIVSLSSTLRAVGLGDDGVGEVICFEIRHLPKDVDKSLLNHTILELTDFDGPTKAFDDALEFGRITRWKVNWKKQ